MLRTKIVTIAADSAALSVLANMCPYSDGSVIFQARSLYSQVFNDMRQFNDLGCEDFSDTTDSGTDTTVEGRKRAPSTSLGMTSLDRLTMTDQGAAAIHDAGSSTSPVDNDGNAASAGSDKPTRAQRYSLSPNPSDGNLVLKQSVPDNEPVKTEVWNSAGSCVFKGILNFAENVSRLSVANNPPGLYLLKLMDSTGKTYTLKFVIE